MYLQLRSITSINISARQKSWLSKEYIKLIEFYADSKNITLDSQLFEFVELQTTKVKKYEPMREQDNIIKTGTDVRRLRQEDGTYNLCTLYFG